MRDAKLTIDFALALVPLKPLMTRNLSFIINHVWSCQGQRDGTESMTWL